MKQISLSFSVLLVIFLTQYKKVPISYINPDKLLQGCHGAQAQHEVYAAKARDWQLRPDSLSTELQALGQVPADTRAAKQQLERYREAAQRQAQQENLLLSLSGLGQCPEARLPLVTNCCQQGQAECGPGIACYIYFLY